MDPYEVLGVNTDADDDTIKKAYRELVKKYHPDKYVNNPLADLAADKIKQINEAYDIITKERASGVKRSSSRNSGYTRNTRPQNTHTNTNTYTNTNTTANRSYKTSNDEVSFATVRMYIQQRRFNEAELMLTQLPQISEWYYLMGLIYLNRGWYDRAREYIHRASQAEPGNTEYAATYSSMNSAGDSYRSYRTGPGSKPCVLCCPGDMCDCCSSLLCADCCCEAMGGDLIGC